MMFISHLRSFIHQVGAYQVEIVLVSLAEANGRRFWEIADSLIHNDVLFNGWNRNMRYEKEFLSEKREASLHDFAQRQ
jgi:hypothetical protein